MDKKLNIPDTVDEVIADLADDAALHTATGWRLAARLAAIVRLSDTQGRHVNSEMKSTVDIAKLRIRGLTSHVTVERYVKVWLETHDGTYPEPGDTVDIPDSVFPPEKKNVGTRTPKTTTLAVEQLLERDGVEAVVEAIPDDQLEDVYAALYKRVDSKRPKVAGAPKDRAITDKGVMKSGQYMMAAQEARDDGFYAPGPEAAIMLRLFERADWDDVLAGLTGRGAN